MVTWSYNQLVLVILLAFVAGYAMGRLRALVAASRR